MAPKPRHCLTPTAQHEPGGPHEADFVVCDETIENLLHRTKDVNFGEDASLIHAGAGPIVMALLRDAAVRLLRGSGIRQIAACLRRHSQCPAEAVALVVGPLPARA